MIIEYSEVTPEELEQDLALQNIGGILLDFKASIPLPQYKVLQTSFNLIYENYPDTLLTAELMKLLLAEDLVTHDKKVYIYELCIDEIIGLLGNLGIDILRPMVKLENLKELNVLASFFTGLIGYEDLIGIKGLFLSSDIHPKERLLNAMTVFYGDDFDTGFYEEAIDSVSELSLNVMVKAMSDDPDLEGYLPEYIEKRIKKNAELIKDTFAGEHIELGGLPGTKLSVLSGLMKDKLSEVTNEERLIKEITAIHLISDESDSSLRTGILETLTGHGFSVTEIMQAEIFIGELGIK